MLICKHVYLQQDWQYKQVQQESLSQTMELDNWIMFQQPSWL